MKKVGIVGGIGAGKSTVTNQFLELRNCCKIDADKIGHEILLRNGEAYQLVLEAFGDTILNQDGEIIRPRLGQIVFSDKQSLQILNNITHPIIRQKIIYQIEVYEKEGVYDWLLLDAPLLIEANLVQYMNFIIAVYTSDELRIERIMARSNYSKEEALNRIKNQKRWEEFMKIADFRIDNSGDYNLTRNQLEVFIRNMEGLDFE